MESYKQEIDITLRVNGVEYRDQVPAHMTLLQFLKEKLFLTGTKEGCGRGECGACTVIMDGRTVNSCLVLAVEADRSKIRTIEGEAKRGRLTALQKAFIDYGGTQCGFCTPGMIMSGQNLLERNQKPSRDEIVEAIAGNLCRCTGYELIIQAIEAAASKKGK
ncbi:MAG: 2Fe-2S iron-sulfur cluster binding domain-containing protein [Proteobacteria bacterium]|nr:2Fe-2S iron-sulfur cluster binding domain-containing protein [Pseudomonadota bacterium]NIS72077.1 2Fe-2S iron-sulfur cluster binding domain-containing protein [Pseudomonadota bacterium]